MKKYIEILKKTKLFFGLESLEIESMLGCLNAKKRSYKKGEYVLKQGDVIREIPVLVEGALHIQKEDYWGNRSILSNVTVGNMFGEAYATDDSEPLQNDVVALSDSVVIFFDVKRIITTCSSACRFHTLVVQNMFFEICNKNRQLVQKLGHMSKRTTREKLISYLSEQANRVGSADFEIPFNREQLADFLSVDRSAMSKELCKMRDSGMIRFCKNKFELL